MYPDKNPDKVAVQVIRLAFFRYLKNFRRQYKQKEKFLLSPVLYSTARVSHTQQKEIRSIIKDKK